MTTMYEELKRHEAETEIIRDLWLASRDIYNAHERNMANLLALLEKNPDSILWILEVFNSTMVDQMKMAVENNHRIEAIKIVRQFTHFGLRDSKWIVDEAFPLRKHVPKFSYSCPECKFLYHIRGMDVYENCGYLEHRGVCRYVFVFGNMNGQFYTSDDINFVRPEDPAY